METVNLIFPHQLFSDHPLLEKKVPNYLIEESLFFRQYAFHKQKLVFHRASMQAYHADLIQHGFDVNYIETIEGRSDIRYLLPMLAKEGVQQIRVVDPTDNWLEERLRKGAEKTGLQLEIIDNPGFLNNRAALSSFFKPEKKKFFQTEFYIQQRKKREILLDESGNPLGGKWSFDTENRKKYPKAKTPPPIQFPKSNTHFQEAVSYVHKYFSENPGSLPEDPIFPFTVGQAKDWIRQFLEWRFQDFGSFEDAIVHQEYFLHHSVLTPMLNVGLITPQQILHHTLSFWEKANIPLNSVEGFVRQIVGWREFMRGMYEVKGVEQRTQNYWGFTRKIPASFYNGTTGIFPVDNAIKKVLQTGYLHHIERLMVLGNFMLLCEFDPDEVYQWFMELFIDAYDWVMVPNVYGMSQFADGGLLATKPYISGSNYLKKMSDYPKGDWQPVWDGLFWRFMHVHRDFFLKNPRLGMLIRTFDKMDAAKQAKHLQNAENFLNALS